MVLPTLTLVINSFLHYNKGDDLYTHISRYSAVLARALLMLGNLLKVFEVRGIVIHHDQVATFIDRYLGHILYFL